MRADHAAAAPRLAAGNDRVRYDGFAMTLHWLTALLVFIQFGLAEFWDFFPHPAKHVMIVAHMSLGIVLTAVVLARLVWRLTSGHRVRDAGQGLVEFGAKALHHVFYGLLLAQMAMGFMTRWTDNHPLSFFGLPIASPFGTFSKATGGWVDEIHDLTAWTIMGLVVVHVAAALYHHVWRRDDVLLRMLPARSP